ncbi:phosphatase PAP2 family protein [Alkalihalobacillus sp. MEB130]|uniref:phosphatase PAP2 family protein n=1 Tax=Alkalihalobacillus sp. MEB130 TaxID=2976704 RepID=UPI0028DE4070|nr:phosphatase PAP2 family protein [Alkalihalobacillus sp. MEB130]MDT8861424.1 phosphatase PAP2 family protein [Alkalihalobacillus sp. MEB130]
MSQSDFLMKITEYQTPFLNALAAIFTFLGNEEFYFLIVPLVYWCITKQAGFRLFYIFLLSVTVNAFLKITFAIQRPIGVEGIHSLFIDSAEVGSHYPYDSFPSGHAQGSTTLWGYLAYLVARPLFWLFSIVLILCISFSRLYAGLHWPTDVATGIMIAVTILFISIRLQDRLSNLSEKGKWMLAIGTPLVIVSVFPEEEGIKYAGFLLGAGVGYLLEHKTVSMVIATEIWRKVLAYAVGIIGLFGLQVGLKVLFPEMMLFDFIRYGCIGLWGLYGAPYIFIKCKIYQREKEIPLPKGQISI